MPCHFSIILPSSTGKSYSKFLDHIDGRLVETTKDLHWHWSEDDSLGKAGFAVFSPLLLMPMLQSMARLYSSLVN